MAFFPIFLSVVFVNRNQASALGPRLTEATACLSQLVSDYELIVIDNGSTDTSLDTLKALSTENGLPNVQVYALTKTVDEDTAAWVGLENALGDFIAIVGPCDPIDFLATMLEHALSGMDVVLAKNLEQAPQSLHYRIAHTLFNQLYRYANGVHLAKEAPQYRILSRKLVNFILQHPQPAVTYRHLPASGGFSRVNLEYRSAPRFPIRKNFAEDINCGIRLLVSTTHAPMRLVTTLCLFGAGFNLLYSCYVLIVAFFKVDIAPGWVSLSLQQSGMFFLLSLVLLVLAEYILNMVRLANEGPAYCIAQEFMSARITRREKLNIETLSSQPIQANTL